MTSFNDKKIAYFDNRIKIDRAFQVAVEKAQVLHDSKCQSVTTNKEIDQAHDTFKVAFQHATQTRNDALLDLGAVPSESNYRAAC